MPTCACTTDFRCAEAHPYRDAYQTALTLEARITSTQAYTAHLVAAGLLAYPATAAPTWRCAEACDPTAPCRRAGKPQGSTVALYMERS